MLTVDTTLGVSSTLKSKLVFFLRKGVLRHIHLPGVVSFFCALELPGERKQCWHVVPLQVLSPVGLQSSSQWEQWGQSLRAAVWLEGRGQLWVKFVGSVVQCRPCCSDGNGHRLSNMQAPRAPGALEMWLMQPRNSIFCLINLSSHLWLMPTLLDSVGAGGRINRIGHQCGRRWVSPQISLWVGEQVRHSDGVSEMASSRHRTRSGAGAPSLSDGFDDTWAGLTLCHVCLVQTRFKSIPENGIFFLFNLFFLSLLNQVSNCSGNNPGNDH